MGVEINEVSNQTLFYRIKLLEVYNESSVLDILHTQLLINDAFVKHVTGKALTTYDLRSFDRDPLLDFLEDYLSIVVLVSFIMPVTTITGTVSMEKENGLKGYMKIMGIQSWLHYAAYFVSYLWKMIIIAAMISAVTTFEWGLDRKILGLSDFGVVWLFLVTFGMSAISYSFLMSTLASTANMSSVLAAVGWFINYLPFVINRRGFAEQPFPDQMAICLFSNTAMSMGFSKISELEKFQSGSKWENFFDFEKEAKKRCIGMGHICIMLLVDSILYTLIALYIEKVYPGSHGIPLKWYFPFTKQYWFGTTTNNNQEVVQTEIEHELFEYPSVPQKITVEVQKLSKIYSGDKFAVKDVSFKLFKNDIVILLGHNAAGKSTTISLLTGLLQPTTGRILINGEEVQQKQEKTSIGLCPQHNILFEDLTVKEHIIFYSCLKGLDQKLNHIDKLIGDLQLQEQLNMKAKHLSGGIKRILSVSLAFCGDPMFVVLDEPSSGLDPVSMRAMWQMLIARKEGRTILISTHSMQEAAIINDRIAVMSEGSLMCYGTSDFLKQRISKEYKLTIKTQTEGLNFIDLAQRYVQNPVMNEVEGEFVEISLEDASVIKITALLKDLEEARTKLNIISLTIRSPSIEDVFMKLGREVPVEQESGLNFNESKASFASEHLNLNRGIKRSLNQISAMFYKYYCYMKRNYKTILAMYLVTILFLVITYIRNEEIKSDIKDEAVTDAYGFCKLMVQKDFGSPGEECDLICRDPVPKSFEPNETVLYFNQIYNKHLKRINPKLHIQTDFSHILLKDHKFWFIDIVHLLKVRDDPLNFNIETNSAFFGALGILFTSFCFILLYVKERKSLFRLIQKIAGLNTGIYWFVAFIVDYLLFLTVLLLNFAMMVPLEIVTFLKLEDLKALVVVMLLFPVASLPVTYLLSIYFEHAIFGFIITMVGYVFCGSIMGIMTRSLEFFNVSMPLLEKGLLFIPPYALTSAIMYTSKRTTNKLLCDEACKKNVNCESQPTGWVCKEAPDTCCLQSPFSFTFPGLGWHIVSLIIVAVLAMAALLAIDFDVFKQWISRFHKIKESSYEVEPDMDNDVMKEKNKIQRMGKQDIENYQLVTKDLSKRFGEEVAVNQLCITIEKFECFGIFGRSSAGKSTIANMITGNLRISSGNVWIDGYSLTHDLSTVYTLIGYCPQFKGLLKDLTGYETMKIIAMLRGYPPNQWNYVIYRLADEFFFTQHLHKPIKNYSGGTQRKLSVALTLIGNTSLVVLDEPTTGIDHAARKQLWQVINQARECRKTVLLTSQMMEECETLCTNLSVLEKGKLKCIGTKEYLKQKYLRGFILELKLKPVIPRSAKERVTRAKEYFGILFHDAELKEEYLESLIYHIPADYRKLHEIFEAVAMSKDFLSIEDFAVKDATLEQIFMFF